MNGTPSANNPDGVHAGNTGDAGNASRLTAEQRQRAQIAEAEAILWEACQGGDADLTQAFSLCHEWLARTPEGAPVR